MLYRWFRHGVLIVMALLAAPGAAQTLALTFDDGFDMRTDPTAEARNATLLDTLRQNGLRAMFFPAGHMVDSDAGRDMVAQWSRQGHLIGNHSYAHVALTAWPSQAAFFDDVLRAQRMFEPLQGWCARLRFPYLDEGAGPEARAAAIDWLAAHGYGVASATIFIDDWHQNEVYEARMREDAGWDGTAFRQQYLERLGQQASAQQQAWLQKIGREPAHVLLLHTNALNLAVLPELIAMFRHKGWSFVDPVSAFADPIYSRDLMRDGQVQPLAAPSCR